MSLNCVVCQQYITASGWVPFCCEVCFDSADADEQRVFESGRLEFDASIVGRRQWYEITPEEAVDIVLTGDPCQGITAPLNENGEVCPWPWEPQQLTGVPMGQYRCLYCGAMCVAGVRHPDYRTSPEPGGAE